MSKGRIVAEFVPQAWINDYAVEVDAEGETEWDVTDHILAMGREKALSLRDDDYPTDDLRNLPNAPRWVREWSGPFVVRVEQSIGGYFWEEDDA